MNEDIWVGKSCPLEQTTTILRIHSCKVLRKLFVVQNQRHNKTKTIPNPKFPFINKKMAKKSTPDLWVISKYSPQ
jgi:hypothetical protein